MARTFIGIDVDNDLLRAIALEESGSGLKPVAIARRQLENRNDSVELVESILEEWNISNARMAMALPASGILVRHLVFPFGDRKKVSAAVPLELGSKLPVDLSDHYITCLPPVATESGHSTFGLALPSGELEKTLEPFDEKQLPLRHLGLAPFSYMGRFSEQPDDCILLALRQDDIAMLLVKGREAVSYRSLLRKGMSSPADTAELVLREIMSMQRSHGAGYLTVVTIGNDNEGELLQILKETLPSLVVPEVQFEDSILPAEYLPACAMARVAAKPEQSFNFRQGPYAFRGNLAPFRSQLIAAAIFVSLMIVCLIGGGWLSYIRKADEADKLQKQLRSIYLQTFQQVASVPKDIPLHMTSRLNEARRQNRLLGGAGIAPLPSLAAVSGAIPTESQTFISELAYDENGIRMAGKAQSFDAVDQLAAGLNANPNFTEARINDAKMNIDGKQVDFRIELDFVGKETQP